MSVSSLNPNDLCGLFLRPFESGVTTVVSAINLMFTKLLHCPIS